jgi:hypothetical protein
MLALAVFALGAALPLVPRAFAQSDEVRPLQDRLDRLERDLNLLQRQVYRGKIESGDTDFSSTPPGNAPAQAGGTSNAVADMEVRLNNLEAQLRSVTGSVEEVRHSIDEVRGRRHAPDRDGADRRQIQDRDRPGRGRGARTRRRQPVRRGARRARQG